MSDYIKRENVINTIQKADYIGDNESLRLAFEIDDILSADVVPKDFHDKTCEAMAKRHTEEMQKLMPKRGEWIRDMSSPIAYKCTACNTLQHWSVIQDGRYHFCPNCGARMKGADDEDN